MIYDVLIIGSGPSGLTAGIYASRASLPVLLLAGKKWGGQLQLTTEVENFPGFPEGIQGPHLMMNMRKQAERFGVNVVDRDATKLDVTGKPFKVESEGETYEAKSIIVATGADTMWLGVPGEDKYIGKGVSSCAPCDAFFYRNKQVIVVGGGDSAMEEALVLTKFASRVTVVHRRGEFRASKIMVDRVMNHKKIEVIWNTSVVEILGEQTVKKVKLTTIENGKEKEWEKEIDGVFVAIGHKPNSELFKGILDIDRKGYLIPKPTVENGQLKYASTTNVPGVFVAGDVYDYTYRQAITAAAYGCQAAMDVERWLEEH